MNGKTFVSFASLLGAFIGLLPIAHSDSWALSAEFNASSDNKAFNARVVPARNNSKAFAVISSIAKGKTNTLWRTALSNRESPVIVFLSDDGQHLVTLDNWHSVGYGEDVVAFYGHKGQLAKYSLEQIAPLQPNETKPGEIDLFSQGYRARFPHSVSSRQWRQYSIEFFFQEAGQRLFCLWLDRDNRWLAWRCSDGNFIKVTPQRAQLFNAEGRRRIFSKSREGDYEVDELNFWDASAYRRISP